RRLVLVVRGNGDEEVTVLPQDVLDAFHHVVQVGEMLEGVVAENQVDLRVEAELPVENSSCHAGESELLYGVICLTLVRLNAVSLPAVFLAYLQGLALTTANIKHPAAVQASMAHRK